MMLGGIAEHLARLARQAAAAARDALRAPAAGRRQPLLDHPGARRELGFAPLIELAEGIRHSVEWYRDACRASGRVP